MQAFGEWQPDLSNFNTGTLDIARNVFPKADGYGPVFGPQAITEDALLLPCRGLWFVQKTDGTYDTYAATAAKLYRYDADTETWANVTRLVGGDYGLPFDDFWSGAQFGNRLIVCQLGDVPQYIDIDFGTHFAALPGSPSTARFVSVMDDKVIFACLASNPRFIQWSDANDSEEYSTGLAGNAEFPDHGAVMGFFPHARVVLLERGMRSIVSTGDIYSFSFPELTHEKGTVSPWACIELGVWLYYRSTSGFYKVNATVEEPINISDNRVTNYFDLQLNQERFFQILGTYDPFNPRLIWTYPTGSTEFNDKALFYDLSLNKWSEGVFDSFCIARLATSGVSLEGGADDINLDAPGLPSLDSKIYQAGAPVLVLIDADGLMSTLAGNTLEAVLEPGVMEFDEDWRVRLKMAGLRAKKAGAATLKVAKLNTLDDDVAFGSAVSMTASGRFPLNHDGAYHKFQFTIASTASDDPWTHAMGWNVDQARTSKR